MNSWTDNLIMYIKSGKAGNCPFCSSRKIEIESIGSSRQSLVFRCLDCKKSQHFDGLRNCK